MTVQNRLQKVTRGLSPLQRITLILRTQRERREPDPELSRISDPQQSKAFNRYAALVYVINRELGALCHTASGFTRALEHSGDQVRLLDQAAGLMEEQEGIERAKRPRDWRTADEMSIPEFLRSLVLDLREALLTEVAQRWREVGALEAVWAELAEEFGGEDPVSPEVRMLAVETRQRLLALAQELGGKRRLVDPDEDTLAEMRRQVDAAFEQLGPLL
jgi:hypothetical protein